VKIDEPWDLRAMLETIGMSPKKWGKMEIELSKT
jgi:hypothetical protein